MLEKLGLKIADLLEHYSVLKSENEQLKNELISLKAENETKDQEIARLVQENANKDIEIEEIVNKIESMLG